MAHCYKHTRQEHVQMFGRVTHPMLCVESQKYLERLQEEWDWAKCHPSDYTYRRNLIPPSKRNLYCEAHVIPYCMKHNYPAAHCDLSDLLLDEPCKKCHPGHDNEKRWNEY